jgi:hypothetical protein
MLWKITVVPSTLQPTKPETKISRDTFKIWLEIFNKGKAIFWEKMNRNAELSR